MLTKGVQDPGGPAPGGPAPAGPAPAGERNHLIDAARIASVLTVVVFHGLFFRIGLAGGRLSLERWEPGPAWWTWVPMLVPLFFVAGGYVDARSLDATSLQARSPDAATRGRVPVARFLIGRGRRIVGPLVLYTAVVGGVATVLAWLPGSPPPTPYPGSAGTDWTALAALLSRDYCGFLWFVTVYLLVVALAPLMVRLHDRFGVGLLVVLWCGAAAVDGWSFAVGNADVRYLNWLLVWPLCHQLGVAYKRGSFTTGPLWRGIAGVAAGVGGITLLILVAGYPGSAIVSYYPPTVAVAFLALAQTCLLGLLDRAGFLRTVSARTERVLGRLSVSLMTVYLWGTTAVVLGSALLVGVGTLLPAASGALVHPVTVSAVSLLVLAVIVPPLGRVDRRLMPAQGTRPRMLPALAAYAFLIAGTSLAWLQGLLLHPGRPWAAAAVLLTLGGAALLALADRPRALPRASVRGR